MKSKNNILISDIGSTTTKTILLDKKGNLLAISKKSTTVEKPDEDVKIGLLRSIKEIEEKEKISLIKESDKIGFSLNEDVDLFITSSAGGGLEMSVVGLTELYSGKIGKKVALGAGALVKDVVCSGDGRNIDAQMQSLKNNLPDMILLVGGVNSGNISNICLKAEFLKKVKLENKYKANPIPILYAGNENAQSEIKKILSDYPLFVDKNVCENFKTPDTRNLQKKINEIFFKHVMEDAPGYKELKPKVSIRILPTPIAVSKTLHKLSKKYGNVILFDIGGATTDVFSFFEGRFYRSVSANIGMSYSIDNVLKKAGTENIKKHIPFEIEEDKILNYIGNKKLNPTSLAVGKEENAIETAVAINGISLALKEHFNLFKQDFDDFRDSKKKFIIIRSNIRFNEFIKSFDTVIGSGGIVSNNFPKESKKIILNVFKKKTILNIFKRKGIKNLFLDKGFLFPHIGILSQYNEKIAINLLENFCLENLNNLNEKEDKNQIYEKRLKKFHCKSKPKIILQTENKLFKDEINRNEVIYQKRKQFLRTYYYPIPINRFKKVEFINNSKHFKCGDKILKFIPQSEKELASFLYAPINGVFHKIEKYCFMYNEFVDKDIHFLNLKKSLGINSLRKINMNEVFRINKDKLFYQHDIFYKNSKEDIYLNAPISGKLVDFDEKKMILTFKRHYQEEKVVSFASGEVISSTNSELKIKAKGTQIMGLYGLGKEISSFLKKEIALIKDLEDYQQFIDSDQKIGIVEKMPFSLFQIFEKEQKDKSLLILNGFGVFEFSQKTSQIFEKNKYKEFYISPKTRIRAGVKRPFIYFE